MEDDNRLEIMVDACIKANAAVAETGSSAMLAIARALLLQLGLELTQREANWRKLLPDAEAEG